MAEETGGNPKWNINISGMTFWHKVLWLLLGAIAALLGGSVCMNCF